MTQQDMYTKMFERANDPVHVAYSQSKEGKAFSQQYFEGYEKFKENYYNPNSANEKLAERMDNLTNLVTNLAEQIQTRSVVAPPPQAQPLPIENKLNDLTETIAMLQQQLQSQTQGTVKSEPIEDIPPVATATNSRTKARPNN